MNRVFYLYHDVGVSNSSLVQTFHTLKTHGRVKFISHKAIINDELPVTESTLVIPGGADLAYMSKLKGRGNAIKKNVSLSMYYIGICAGAYYAAKRIYFENFDKNIISDDRELSFFPDLIKGSYLTKYIPNSFYGARAVRIFDHLSNQYTSVFYNGGGIFVNVNQYINIKICASYENGIPAVIL